MVNHICNLLSAPNVSSLYEIDLTAWPDLLQQASIPIIEEKECQQKEGYDEKLTENMVCAGYPEGHVDSCNVWSFSQG